MRKAQGEGEQIGLSDDEIALFDALGIIAVLVLGDETLREIAREVAQTVRENSSIDWTKREQVRADLRRHVKRVVLKYGYPPDKTVTAADTDIQQAEFFAREIA